MESYVYLLIIFTCSVARADKTPAKGTNAAAGAGQTSTKADKCNFTTEDGVVIVREYDKREYVCRRCSRTRTILTTQAYAKTIGYKDLCLEPTMCNGLLCGLKGNTTCLSPRKITVSPSCSSLLPRVFSGYPNFPLKNRDGVRTAKKHIPLIIGFSAGGILLAIVVAGIFLGRNQRTDETDNSENMTTPVSLSNSEWLSNGNAVGNNWQNGNMRVEEASREDLTLVPNGHTQNGDINGTGYRLKSTSDDGSSVGQNSYYDSDVCMTFYPTDGRSTVRSYRSDDSSVMLDDGYRPGGNFVGSVDPEVRDLLESKEHKRYQNATREADQDMFTLQDVWGQSNPEVPCNMTHESITLSLTHSPHYGGMEYVIEDQDLVAFQEPASFKKRNREPKNNMKPLEETDEGVMRISVQYRDGDSDFEDTGSVHSRQNFVLHNGRSELYDSSSNGPMSPDSNCVANDSLIRSPSGLHVESPCSESGIEVSCNSKDSCEIRLKTANAGGNMEISCHARSWNENCKGNAAIVENPRANTPKNTRFFPRSENRSRSCNWKSPAAPTHSSAGRKYSAPSHCQLSTPGYARPHVTNLTHVFVDVHRNMVSSDEDMLGYQSTERRRPVSISSSDCSSMSDLSSLARLPTPEPGPFSTSSMPRSQRSPPNTLINQKRNKSMYIPRDNALKRTPDCKPRMVRFSSSGSGEYAIPFGSLVP